MVVDRTIAALGDPTRREIPRRLADSPRRAGELAAGSSISCPTVCKPLRFRPCHHPVLFNTWPLGENLTYSPNGIFVPAHTESYCFSEIKICESRSKLVSHPVAVIMQVRGEEKPECRSVIRVPASIFSK
jgi:hypothetical protein